MQVPRTFTPTRVDPAHTNRGARRRAAEQIATLALAVLTLAYAVWTALGEHPSRRRSTGALGLTLYLVARQMFGAARARPPARPARPLPPEDTHLTALVRHLHDVIAIVDPTGVIRYISPSVERRLGHPAAAVLGTDLLALVLPSDVPAARALLADALASPHQTIVTDLRLLAADGTHRTCELFATGRTDDQVLGGIVVTCHDVTEHRAFEPRATRAGRPRSVDRPAQPDPGPRSGGAWHRPRPPAQQRVAVLSVDLDNFKLVNDSLGLQAGDDLLTQVVERIGGCLRAEDTLGQVAGDELAILIEDVLEEADAIAVAERVLAALRAPFLVTGQSLVTTASIGIALSGPAVDQPASLLRNADLAMHEAKARGKACWMLFNPELNTAARERLGLEMALRGALDRGELHLTYQPIVDLATGEIREVEALLRWDSPDRGSIPPSQFIPVAEETGLIQQIGTWTLREACWQITRWNAERHDDPLSVGVNLSGRQLQDPALVETVTRILGETGLDASCLKLELTESVMMEYADATIDTLNRLKALGVQLAIDDFGPATRRSAT